MQVLSILFRDNSNKVDLKINEFLIKEQLGLFTQIFPSKFQFFSFFSTFTFHRIVESQ